MVTVRVMKELMLHAGFDRSQDRTALRRYLERAHNIFPTVIRSGDTTLRVFKNVRGDSRAE
jgi:hypothetical protein